MIRHIKNILICLVLLLSCTDDNERHIDSTYQAELIHSSGEKIKIDILTDDASKVQGLSGIKPEGFSETRGVFFYYKNDDEKNFWMPDTYFNLDIIYLDKALRILKIDRNVPHHPGHNEPPYIARMNPMWCRHVLEVKALSPFSKVIKPGDILSWKGDKFNPVEEQ